MFRKLLRALLPSFVPAEVDANYAFFDKTPENEPLPFADKAPVNDQAIPYENDLEGAYLDYLFGCDARPMQQNDSLSHFIYHQLSLLMHEPEQLLSHLPVMPASISQVLKELDNPDFDVQRLLAVVEREPAMAADLIKLANSPRYRRREQEITELKAAFMSMGANGLLEGVVQSYIKRFTPRPSIYYRQFGEKIWQHALQTADFAKLAASDSQTDPGAAYFTALLYNLGTMIIFELMIEAFNVVDPDVTPSSAAFKRLIREYSHDLTLTLANYWQLPQLIVKGLHHSRLHRIRLDRSQAQLSPLAQLCEQADIASKLCCLQNQQQARQLSDHLTHPVLKQRVDTHLSGV